MKKETKTIGELRKELGFTQRRLANEAGISQQSLSVYERGVSIPSPAMLTKIAKALEVPPEEISIPSRSMDCMAEVKLAKNLEQKASGEVLKLSDQEFLLIKLFRKLPTTKRNMILLDITNSI